MVPSWWMPTDCANQAPAPPQQQVLKLQELLRFENSLELWQPKADASQQVWLQASSNLADVSPQIENGQIGVPEQAWEAAEDVEEILSSTVVQNAEQCAWKGEAGWLEQRHFLGLPSSILGSKAYELTYSRAIMRTVWAVGKLGLKGRDVQGIIAVLAETSQPILTQFSCQELSNTLWGLARLSESMQGLKPEGIRLAYTVMAQGVSRLSQFSTQCLTNSLWAVAKLGLRGEEVRDFSNQCLSQIHLVLFKVVGRFCIDAARRAMASEDLLKLFFPQASVVWRVLFGAEPEIADWSNGALHGTLGHGEADWPKGSCQQDQRRFRGGVKAPQPGLLETWSLSTMVMMFYDPIVGFRV
ncbi:unnamed protein product [Symbiodinium sp. CCMP2592]|nr:unnamed protein product [Symbiodinium sp. CCMP2592]